MKRLLLIAILWVHCGQLSAADKLVVYPPVPGLAASEHYKVRVRPAREDSWEAAFRHVGYARSLTDWRGLKRHELEGVITQTLLERAIGVVYRPQSELASHYFEAVIADQFDAYVWFEETHAVTPLGSERPHGAPETWPFGL